MEWQRELRRRLRALKEEDAASLGELRGIDSDLKATIARIEEKRKDYV